MLTPFVSELGKLLRARQELGKLYAVVDEGVDLNTVSSTQEGFELLKQIQQKATDQQALCVQLEGAFIQKYNQDP